MTGGDLYFDDLAVGDAFHFGPYHVQRDEMLAFNHQWDPLPIHVDDEAARARGHREVTASGQYTLCVKQALLNQAPWTDAVIGALGFDELRFPNPVYPGDALSLTIECTASRPSRSKPDRGIVTFDFTLRNAAGETVLSYIDTVMFQRREAPAAADADRAEAADTPEPPVTVATAEALPLASKLLSMKQNGVDPGTRITFIAKRLDLQEQHAEIVHLDFEAGVAHGVSIAMGFPPSRKHTPADEAFHAIASQLGLQDMESMMERERRAKERRKRRNTLIAGGICLAGLLALALLFLAN